MEAMASAFGQVRPQPPVVVEAPAAAPSAGGGFNVKEFIESLPALLRMIQGQVQKSAEKATAEAAVENANGAMS
jgi:hypothetical protein